MAVLSWRLSSTDFALRPSRIQSERSNHISDGLVISCNGARIKKYCLPDLKVRDAITKELPTAAKKMMNFERCMLSVCFVLTADKIDTFGNALNNATKDRTVIYDELRCRPVKYS
ncbi:hypothetical protein EAF00_001928 [Botryotinia globosa]|nr:hypothetical protein EAF00_001928 [Botryotinia globosa]